MSAASLLWEDEGRTPRLPVLLFFTSMATYRSSYQLMSVAPQGHGRGHGGPTLSTE